MGRRSHLELVIDAVKAHPGSQASPAKVAQFLRWDIDKVRAVAARGNDDLSMPLYIGKGGVIKYRGSEVGASVGVYADVIRVIEKHWAPKLGLRQATVLDVSKSGRRGAGVWTHPDLLLAAYPRRRRTADEPRRLHAIEVETAAGFDLRSVYQAHAQGRDANYTWVFGNKAPGVDKSDWDRVLWTVQQLGVGLVTFEKAHVYGTWKTLHQAEFRETTPRERSAFLDLTTSPTLRDEIGDW